MRHRERFTEHRVRGSLEHHVGASPADRERLEDQAREVYHETGTLTVFWWQRTDDWESATVDAIGARLYGRRQRGRR